MFPVSQDRTPTQWERDNPWEATLAADIGKAIADARDRLGISQGELATMVGVSRNSIANYEIGRGIPRLGLLLQLASALNSSPVSLMYPNPSDELSNLVEMLPGVETTGFVAAQWFSGHDPGPGSGAKVEPQRRAEWRENTRLLRLWREIHDLQQRQSASSRTGRDGRLSDTQQELIESYQRQIDEKRHELGLDVPDV